MQYQQFAWGGGRKGDLRADANVERIKAATGRRRLKYKCLILCNAKSVIFSTGCAVINPR